MSATADPGYGVAPPGHRLPAPTRLGPVRLRVADLDRSEDFYGRVLGLVPRDRGGGHLSLRAPGGERPLVELVERPGIAPVLPRGRLGLYHFALLVPDRSALARFALHAMELGRHRLGMADHAVSEALYLNDPDGLGIEVYADRPREEWRTRGRQLVITTDPLDFDALIAEAGSGSFEGLPADTVVGHVHLHVGDLDRAEDFYHRALGLDKVVWGYPGALFLSAGGYHHHVGTNVWAAGAPPAGADEAGLIAWTLLLPTEADVRRLRASVEGAGFEVGEEGARGGPLLRDPWGTAVEVVAVDEETRQKR